MENNRQCPGSCVTSRARVGLFEHRLLNLTVPGLLIVHDVGNARARSECRALFRAETVTSGQIAVSKTDVRFG